MSESPKFRAESIAAFAASGSPLARNASARTFSSLRRARASCSRRCLACRIDSATASALSSVGNRSYTAIASPNRSCRASSAAVVLYSWKALSTAAFRSRRALAASRRASSETAGVVLCSFWTASYRSKMRASCDGFCLANASAFANAARAGLSASASAPSRDESRPPENTKRCRRRPAIVSRRAAVPALIHRIRLLRRTSRAKLPVPFDGSCRVSGRALSACTGGSPAITKSRSSTRSLALRYRWFRSFASIFRMTSLHPCEISGRRMTGVTGFSFRCFSIVSSDVSPLNGTAPVIMW